MNLKIVLRAAAFACGTFLSSVAQETANPAVPTDPKTTLEGPGLHKPTPREIAAGKIAAPMFAAVRMRTELANQIFSGSLKAAEGILKLRGEASPSGLRIEPDADFAYAAIDVGQRLVALGRPLEARVFFRSAEQSLDPLVKRTADVHAKEKSQYLQKLALIRGRFLNKVPEAKADIEQAIALQPEDTDLKAAKDNLARTNADVFQAKPKG